MFLDDTINEDKIIEQDVLMWGLGNRMSSSAFNASWSKVYKILFKYHLKNPDYMFQRLILLFPNRIEIPTDHVLIPIDEINSVVNGKIKESMAIQIKSSSRDLALNFGWKFEMDQWYHGLGHSKK